MAKEGSRFARRNGRGRSAAWLTPAPAEARVLHVQTKLHKWTSTGPDKQFPRSVQPGPRSGHASSGLAADPSESRITDNRGDKMTRADVEDRIGVGRFLEELRASLKDGSYRSPAGPGAQHPQARHSQGASARNLDVARPGRADGVEAGAVNRSLSQTSIGRAGPTVQDAEPKTPLPGSREHTPIPADAKPVRCHRRFW
jgi:hypothetical protein